MRFYINCWGLQNEIFNFILRGVGMSGCGDVGSESFGFTTG